jgi:hypothetical protein
MGHSCRFRDLSRQSRSSQGYLKDIEVSEIGDVAIGGADTFDGIVL